MRLIDVDAFKSDYRMADECKDCQTPVRTCEYDRVYTKMDFCEWLDSAPTVQPERNSGADMKGERKMKEDTLKINVEADGMDEVTEKVEELADAMNGLFPQVTFKNCVDCTINFYPSQIKRVE